MACKGGDPADERQKWGPDHQHQLARALRPLRDRALFGRKGRLNGLGQGVESRRGPHESRSTASSGIHGHRPRPGAGDLRKNPGSGSNRSRFKRVGSLRDIALLSLSLIPMRGELISAEVLKVTGGLWLLKPGHRTGGPILRRPPCGLRSRVGRCSPSGPVRGIVQDASRRDARQPADSMSCVFSGLTVVGEMLPTIAADPGVGVGGW